MDKIGMVVNYFWSAPSRNGHRVITSTTRLALLLLKENPIVGNVVLVDGSPLSDRVMREACRELDVNYLHAGRELALAEGYNLGWQSLSETYIGLMANDILPHPPATMEILYEWIKRPDIGCVFPYLTEGRKHTQHVDFFSRSRQTCEPASMTLNLNVFKRSVLEEIGGVDEGYNVGFYDPILLIKTRQLGFRVVMVGGTRAIHVFELTKYLGGSALTNDLYERDKKKWFEQYEKYASEDGIGKLKLWPWPCSTSLPAMISWWIAYHLPSARARNWLFDYIMWAEPYFTKYPAQYGKKKMFSL
jgi:hypothetical protein